MNLSLTLRIQGGLLLFLGSMLLTPVPFSLYYRPQGELHDGALFGFLAASLAALVTGACLLRWLPSRAEMTHREAFATVAFGWISFAAFGALPYLFSGVLSHPVDAFFESMSGFTTTGATIIRDLSQVSESVLFWRSLTQWLGGMGIIVLSLAILPFLGVGGMQLFEAEVPGPTADRLAPRIQDTARLLWGVYFVITVAELVLLWIGDMSFFEAINHAFTTMATGGFSTSNQSIAAFSRYSQWVIVLFMFLAGANFSLHFLALRGRLGSYWRSEEFRCYVLILLGAAVLLACLNSSGSPSFATGFGDVVFQTVSLMTTTGYVTADYELWSPLGQCLLLSLMFVGGCAGSTGGSVKVVRYLVVVKHAFMQIWLLVHPRQVRVLKLDGKAVPREVVASVLGFMALFMGVFVLASLLITAMGVDMVTAGASVIACLGNVGPGLGEVGPTDNYAHLPWPGKLALSVAMLVGRLEIFTVLVLFLPSFWRK